MKIISIVGARPQFIKLAPLSNIIKTLYDEVIIHTGQHYDEKMSNIFFNELKITKPHYNLNINQGNHGIQTGKMMIELESVILKENPNLIIIFGDTNSTLAGAIVGSKLNIPIIHIEAGLRSFNKKMPEEINRIAADHLSDYLFAPTPTAIQNLTNENLSDKSFLTGDIMVESLKYVSQKIVNTQILKTFNLENQNYNLLTLHRPYNVDNPQILTKIFKDLKNLSNKIIFPIHPRSRDQIKKNNITIPDNVLITNPLGYLDFVALQMQAQKIITDSGGIQKEAYILKKPCITLRYETEWVETVNSGWNILFNLEKNDNLVSVIENFKIPQTYKNIFGDNVLQNMISIINNLA
tara:strand:+ start:866 stop:1921 length:1056 start_codon:yes stop_codon:yes gene_type:complete